ncbi:MAG: thioredoxin family protein [Deltaproteobacteria bacterium]|nr:thioredoxin family protein [Deltaproteobacteria bacterium]
MHVGRLSVLMLLLLGWLWLSPGPTVLAQATMGPAAGPKILEFDRKFCPICKASELVIRAVKDRYPGQFDVEKLYIDEADVMFRRYKVAIVPTQVFLNAAGQQVARHEGVYKKEALIQKLRELKFIGD